MKNPLDIYDDMPHAMKVYISHFGWNFNKKACDYAVKQMIKKSASGKIESIQPWSKEEVEQMLKQYGIELEQDTLYNSTYVANMAKADYLMSSIPDEQHIALYIKDVIDDIDGDGTLPFRFFLQKCVAMGEPVDFEDFL